MSLAPLHVPTLADLVESFDAMDANPLQARVCIRPRNFRELHELSQAEARAIVAGRDDLTRAVDLRRGGVL